MEEKLRTILDKNDLRNTKVRKRILQFFLQKNEAISHREIEDELSEIDRTTVYRTLKTFEEKGIIHHAYDGGITPKYALCEEECNAHQHEDNHAHFSCEVCHKTICIESIKTPQVPELQGYKVTNAELVLEGYCESCLKKM